MADTLTFHTGPQMIRLSPPSVLQIRNFRLLWIGEGISLLGDRFYQIALPWLIQSIHIQQPDLLINAIQRLVEKAWVAQMLEIK